MSPSDARLRDTIEAHAETHGTSLNDLTVMSTATDPYRIDTPANRRDAQWLAEAWTASGARRPLHLRGVHYALISGAPIGKPSQTAIPRYRYSILRANGSIRPSGSSRRGYERRRLAVSHHQGEGNRP
jgi:hypothetical protein